MPCAPFPLLFGRNLCYNMDMFRIWAKVYEGEHIARQTVYEGETQFSYADFFGYLAEMCTTLDVPTPVLLKQHIFQYAKFRHVVFRPADFMENVTFTKLVVENIT